MSSRCVEKLALSQVDEGVIGLWLTMSGVLGLAWDISESSE